MGIVASQITSLTIVYTTVYSDADQRKHQSSASLAFVWGIHRDRWIPRTNGQLRGKYFHLMTSSWLDDEILFLSLTHLSLKNDHIYKRISAKKDDCIFIRISLKLVLNGPIENKSAFGLSNLC